MASTATTEASEIKRRGRQRLIGAVVLVALLVVFVPMLLDSEPKPSREGPSLAIPPKDPAPPLPAPAPRVVPSTTSPAPAKDAPKPTPTPADPAKSEPAKVPATAAAAPAPSVAGSAPAAASVTPAEPSKPAVAASTAAQPPHSGFAVQVGAFRDEAKLKQARDKLAAAKVPHYTERLEAKGGGLTRLRAGPFETREKAEAALATLKRASLDGKVVPLQ